jgi:hypothetical protein
MEEKQISNTKSTKFEVKMAGLVEGLNVEARVLKELYEQILRLENRLKNVLSPREPMCQEQNEQCDEKTVMSNPHDDSPLIKSLDDFGRTIVSNVKEMRKLDDRLSEIFGRLDI